MMVKPIDVPDVPISTIQAANEFGLDLFRRMYTESPDENWITSPASMWFVLSMAIGGAGGDTLAEMRSAMFLHDDYSLVDLGRLRRAEEPLITDGTVRIANLLAVHDNYSLLPTFETYCRDVMGSETIRMSFSDPETLTNINGWVSDVTRGKISNIVQALSSEDRVVLINAIYLKAQWVKRFDEAKPDWFNGLQGRVHCDMMEKKERMRYARGEGYQVAKIPYHGDRLSILVLLPDPGMSLTAMLGRMTATDMQAILGAGSTIEVNLQMPRFKIEMTMESGLMGALRAMGMRAAFTLNADFSPMSGTRDLFVGKVIQKAVIEVDEVGTEAAAATGGMLRCLNFSLKEDTVSLRLDRPFFYAIVDEQTNLVILNGVLNRPTNQGVAV